MMGGELIVRLPRAVRLGREHARHAARTATTPPTLEVARGIPRAPEFPAAARRARGGRDARRDDVRGARRVPRRSTSPRRRRRCRSRPTTDASCSRSIRGDDRLEPSRSSMSALEDRLAPVDRRRDPRRVRRVGRLARPGRLRGRGRRRRRRCARASSSPARTATAGTCAASRPAATSSRAFADLREPSEGDRCPKCGGALTFETAIEVGHIFKFGDTYTRGARRDVPRRGRQGEAAGHGAATASARRA